MTDWSKSALDRLRARVATESQQQEVLLRQWKLIEEKAQDYWRRLVSSIRENLDAFCEGSREIRTLGLREHAVPSAKYPTLRIEREEYPRVELCIELVIDGRMIRFNRTSQAAWDGDQFFEQGMFCLRVDDNANIYITHKGARITENQAVAVLLDPVVFPDC